MVTFWLEISQTITSTHCNFSLHFIISNYAKHDYNYKKSLVLDRKNLIMFRVCTNSPLSTKNKLVSLNFKIASIFGWDQNFGTKCL